ncbi:AraC family transcriptional regulator [Marinobacter sp. X15-166B]|uniref:AraC family transcriptional regulator n=1 Tax=Marinobacter sp. X15-166B TaxID=1897620 RepID=UPI00085BDA2B|nr:helix-turn-helix transcriptional regulator [Marinobacter sp. X15-166B]OEY67652.1 AraC family transcriptional regulator [Marinobacter sp. X15-166B]
MNRRQTDKQQQLLDELARLTELPRPVLGQQLALPNQAIATDHQHPWVQLSYAIHGVLTVETATASYLAPPSLAVWIPPGVVHSVRCSADTEIRSLYLAPEVLPDRSVCQVLEIRPLLRELIVAFSEFPVEYDEAGPEGRLVGVLLDELAAANSCELILPWPRDVRLQPLCRYLGQNPDCQQPLSYFSAQLGVSDKTLMRDFRKHTGMSFRQWRQRSRLLAALPLLEQNMSVTEVALACGYDSLSAFIAAFRQLLGYTPGNYRQRY